MKTIHPFKDYDSLYTVYIKKSSMERVEEYRIKRPAAQTFTRSGSS